MKRALRFAVYPAMAVAVLGGTMLVVGAASDDPKMVAPGTNATVCSTVTVPRPPVAAELAANAYLEALTEAQLECILDLE